MLPSSLSKYVTCSHYVDTNIMHYFLTGRFVTKVLSFINQNPIDLLYKKQATVEIATYGSDFVKERTIMERNNELSLTLRYLGISLRDFNYTFGNNKSVVGRYTFPYAKIHKGHTVLSFHRVSEVIYSKMVQLYHIPNIISSADILSKYWGYIQVCDTLKPFLF